MDGQKENFNSDDQRRERLTRAPLATAGYNPKYSVFIRWMRLALPLVALMITAIVFTWSSMKDENIVPTKEQRAAQKAVGKNELLSPRFESMDNKKQPYTITAKRAVQGETDENLVMLEEPVADMMLSSGNWVALKAQQGSFWQNNQRLLLRGNVLLFHDRGYQMETAQLHIDLEKKSAWSEDSVYAQGPAGTLKATGLQANGDDGHLVFKGPAELVLVNAGSNLGDSTP